MSAAYPEDEETEAAREGTASHELAERLINFGLYSPDTVTDSVRAELVGTVASNNVVFTDEMFDAAWVYADDVVKEIKRSSDTSVSGTEHPIKAPSVHELSFGTLDSYLYDEANFNLFIWDYKYGFGVVEAFENWQAINYAAGLFDELGIDGITDQYLTVHIRIAQPRAFHRDGSVRNWSIKGSDLRGYFNTLTNNANQALSSTVQTHTGTHCRYCEARHACPAALKAGLDLYEVTGQPLPIELSVEAMGVQLSIIQRARKQLEYLESGFEEQIKGKIRAGVRVPGWALKEGVGRVKWSKPVDEIVAMGDMMGKDLRKAEAITPTQAKGLGLDEALISAYSERPNTGLKLVAVDSKAREVFSK